ncbi:hypothetical protein HBB16_08340 [Pseudonocardia sp. MCCB 268]|nr:hypothetical protein [Pseudonocardia cytotoxica]
MRRTFRELADRVARLAGAHSVRSAPNARATASGCSRELRRVHSSTYRCLRLGRYVFAPINNRWSPAEMAYQVTDAGIEVVTSMATRPRTRALQAVSPQYLRELVYCGVARCLPGSGPTRSSSVPERPSTDGFRARGWSASWPIGGTTGEPKGVMPGRRPAADL